jgi:phosphinothricin acetyltransferase
VVEGSLDAPAAHPAAVRLVAAAISMNTTATKTTMIRAANERDAGRIADIYNHYIVNTVITFEEQIVSPSEMSARIADVQAQGLPWLVAEQGSEVVGYSYASPWKTRSAYRFAVETTVYLRHGMQGRGVGKTLYAALLPILKAKGIHAVIGGAALPNPASVALHENLGFEQVATFRQVGFKHGGWVDVAYWQLILQPEGGA